MASRGRPSRRGRPRAFVSGRPQPMQLPTAVESTSPSALPVRPLTLPMASRGRHSRRVRPPAFVSGRPLLKAVAYGSGKYIAVGASGKASTSVDGILPGQRSPRERIPELRFGSETGAYGVAYGNGRFVAVGGWGKASTSTDGSHVDGAYARGRIRASNLGPVHA
jgi:hypothetical protein